MTKIISILNQKGGVGKTTIATNLAHGLHMRRLSVLLVDADPQGSARDWNDLNKGTIVPVIGMERETLPQDLNAIKDKFDVIIIDGPPRISLVSIAATRVSDVILIPVQPSPYDVMATADTVEMIKQRHEVVGNDYPKVGFIISRYIKNTILSREVHDPLVAYGFPVLSSKTSQAVLYASSAAKGETIFSHGENLTAHEFNTLIEEVIARYLYK
jgi:chromosome partitioning protein